MNTIKSKLIIILAYGVGGLFLFSGAIMSISDSFLAGLFMALSGLAVFPPFWGLVNKRFKYQLSKFAKLGTFFALMIVSGFLMPEMDPEDKIELPQSSISLSDSDDQTKDNPVEMPQQTENNTPNAEEVKQPNPKDIEQPSQEDLLLDDLWKGVDASIKSRKGIDISYDSVLNVVNLDYTDDSFWDENATVREAYTKLVKFGPEAFKHDEVDSLVVNIKTTLIDNYGEKSTSTVVIVEMLKEDFNKFNWSNLRMLPVSDQIENVAIRYYVHPVLRKNLNKDKLYLSY